MRIAFIVSKFHRLAWPLVLVLSCSWAMANNQIFSNIPEEDPRWDHMLEIIKASKIKTPTRAGIYLTEQRITSNDPNQDRIASYISVVGEYNTDGEFLVRHLEVVWEHWEKDIPADLWRFDQWTFRITPDGRLLPYNGRHNRGTRPLTEFRLGVSETKSIPTDEARLQLRWKELKSFWLEELAPVTIQK